MTSESGETSSILDDEPKPELMDCQSREAVVIEIERSTYAGGYIPSGEHDADATWDLKFLLRERNLLLTELAELRGILERESAELSTLKSENAELNRLNMELMVQEQPLPQTITATKWPRNSKEDLKID